MALWVPEKKTVVFSREDEQGLGGYLLEPLAIKLRFPSQEDAVEWVRMDLMMPVKESKHIVRWQTGDRIEVWEDLSEPVLALVLDVYELTEGLLEAAIRSSGD